MSWDAKLSLRILAVLVAAVAGVDAEILYERDGIRLEGTARRVTRGASVCNVVKERHSEQVYERIKANHGRSLHVWRLDYAAHNGSGRQLEHLKASLTIAAEWPPCTTWSGPEGSYPKTVQSGGSIEVLQRPYGMGPSEQASDRVYVLALEGHEPRYGSWEIDYRIAAGSDSDPVSGGGSSERPSGAAVPLRAGQSRVFDGMDFVWVPAGEFQMGSTSAEARVNEQPPVRVRIIRGFWLGKYEVTQSQWQAVMGANPAKFSECGPDCPVEKVSWNDAQDFVTRLNDRVGTMRYRLPTEAEWEYAARAGTRGDRYGDLDAIAWYAGNSGQKTHPVGLTVPNAWGLYDMLGNVWEWVEDRYGNYPGASTLDPRGRGGGKLRVGRGGSWDAIARACRASARGNGLPGNRTELVGFRLLRTQ